MSEKGSVAPPARVPIFWGRGAYFVVIIAGFSLAQVHTFVNATTLLILCFCYRSNSSTMTPCSARLFLMRETLTGLMFSAFQPPP